MSGQGQAIATLAKALPAEELEELRRELFGASKEEERETLPTPMVMNSDDQLHNEIMQSVKKSGRFVKLPPRVSELAFKK